MPTKEKQDVDPTAKQELEDLYAMVKSSAKTADDLAAIISEDKTFATAAVGNDDVLRCRFYVDSAWEFGGREGYPMAWMVAHHETAAEMLMRENPDVMGLRAGSDGDGPTLWHLVAGEHPLAFVRFMEELVALEHDTKMASAILGIAAGRNVTGAVGRVTVAEELINSEFGGEAAEFLVGFPELVNGNHSLKEAIAGIVSDAIEDTPLKFNEHARVAATIDDIKFLINMRKDIAELDRKWKSMMVQDRGED